MVRGYLVCKNAWLVIYSISNSRFNKIVKQYNDGNCTISSQRKKRRKTKTFVAKAWMESAFSKIGDKIPDSFTIHLPCYLNYKTLYAYMVEDLTRAGENEVIKYSQFCNLMHTDFNEITIPKVTLLYSYNIYATLYMRSTN